MGLNKKLTILGGGPAGLGVAYYAKKAGLGFELLEATGHIGGNCKTITFGEFKFDTGAHRLHGKSDEVVEEMKELLKDDLREVDKPSYIFHQGKYIDFPLSPLEVFSKLKPSTSIKAVFSFMTRKRNPEQQTFKGVAEAKYGSVISDLFLNNYSEKLWGLPTEQLSPRISGNRLKYLNFRTLVRDSLFPNAKPRHMEGKFYYPIHGFGQIAEGLGDYAGRESILLNKRIMAVHHDGKRIEQVEMTDGSRANIDELASSLPLTLLIRMLTPRPDKEILELAEKFTFRHLTLICFFLKKESVNSGATIYFPSEEFEFTRGYEPRNRSPKMSPEGMTSFIVEVPTHDLGEQDKEALLEKIKGQLTGYGLFSESEIIDTTFYDIPYAYPVLRLGIEEDIEKLITYLSRFENLHLTGRNGLFEYSWTHDMLTNGKRIIKELCNGRHTG